MAFNFGNAERMGKKSKSFGNIKKLQLKKTIKGKFEGGQGKYLVRNK